MLDDSRIPIPIPDEPRSPIAVLLGFRHRCDRKDGKPRANPFGKIDGPLENFGNSALSENLMDSFYSEFEDRF